MRVTKEIMNKIHRPGTVGQIEQLAGLPQDENSRREFWIAADDEARARFKVPYTSGTQVVTIWRERCEKMIVARIKCELLCLI
jgi:hypothetical protein